MVKIGEKREGCRYWGYEPATTIDLHKGLIPLDERRTLREKLKAEREKIKAAGFKPCRMGFVSVTAARLDATSIERETGIEMHVFNHDYL